MVEENPTLSFTRHDGSVITFVRQPDNQFAFDVFVDGEPFNISDKLTADYEAGLFKEKK